MKRSLALIFLSTILLPARDTDVRRTFSAKYEGGTAAFERDDLKAIVAADELLLVQNHRRVVVPLKNVTGISCGTESRRRLGAIVLDRVPRLRLGSVEAHYLGLTWVDASAGKTEVVLKLPKDDYQEVLTVLERRTGRKAIDTVRVPTTVRYSL